MKQNKYDDPAFFANYSQRASSSSRLNIRSSPRSRRKTGIMVSMGSDYTGRSIITRRKGLVRPDFWVMRWSNIIVPSPPM